MDKIICMKNVSKEFKVLNRREGLKGSFLDLFSRDYKIVKAVNQVNLEIEQGEIVGYLGPNGAGKSTTIKMMTGVLEPTSGEIIVDGRVPCKDRNRHAQNIGVVFGQRSQLWWALPAIESFKILKDMYQVKGLGQFAFGVLVLSYAWKNLSLGLSLIIIIKLIVSLITASLFMIAIMNIAAASCFWLINSGYIMVMAFRFKDYAKYPVSIFNSAFKLIFTFVIPIAFIAYYPSLIFLRPDEIPLLTWLSPFIGILFFYLSYLIWMKGARSYSGTGS
ncbi:MAG TPA: ABC-2 family transporter protein [Defluviitaleaceae bacterium]|nr:ATP-binding cassette domain-containing protein [Candidatus Epulonipiscium sp.]HOQ17775.1 ABC-2 family transporter protein [Defluviitaleaceae bacterium]HPT77439.1 ABC-2 family transporter protein [Defluviitaleaceae bacterium]HQD51197.1 ABC-2 family transporter protein [Defluviitaleaceae bacterium]